MKLDKIADPDAKPLDVAVLVLPDSNMLSFAGAVDPMRAANRLAGRRLFSWRFHTPTGQPAPLTSGVTVPGPALARLDGCDLLIVVASFNLDAHDRPDLRASLRRLAGSGACIAGIDGGPWLMAAAGLLDGYDATTHWEDLERFATRFPAVAVRRDRYHIDRNRLTSGGALPAIDMMLELIGRRAGRDFAARVAGLFIYDPRPEPARAQNRRGSSRHSAVTKRAAALMEAHLDTPLPVPELARRVGVSQRALAAQFRARLGVTPKGHYLDLRLGEAFRLVTDTDLPIVQIALATGFNSAAGFARAFKAAHGLSARALRRHSA